MRIFDKYEKRCYEILNPDTDLMIAEDDDGKCVLLKLRDEFENLIIIKFYDICTLLKRYDIVT